ncbi:hypothetical protein [Skermanella aerolata]|uniref:hypothetical protein n=1 Tax=Skermanella aerolata TaxID=393310 RepID=UPI0005EA635D|nr:hypothetical protein [Skermanella aerolata]KJB94613.1 hypothetical protein N826_10515 [Skermanella aerolata KACC 11604]
MALAFYLPITMLQALPEMQGWHLVFCISATLIAPAEGFMLLCSKRQHHNPIYEAQAMLKNTDFLLTLTAFAGLVTHVLTTTGTAWPFTRSDDAGETDSIFWTSDRLSQSGEGHERPYGIE